ncbi:MAG: M23 family metallopeptidase [bacterium]
MFTHLLLALVMSINPVNSKDAHREKLTDREKINIDLLYAPFDNLKTDVSDYRWPINVSNEITSNFGDYRATHLHCGIDISTNGEKGHPVFASRDGEIFRIRVSHRGYGKMLYIRHADGFVTTYAHLQKFDDEIDRYVKKVQKQTRRYTFDLRSDISLFTVSKGEVIAYSGDTGIGGVHLHFEVLDSLMNPINPLLFPQLAEALADTVPPIFSNIALTPLRKNTTIQGKQAQRLLAVKRLTSGEYTIPGLLAMNGSIGIAARVTDHSNILKHQIGPYRFEVYLDDELTFTSEKKQISDEAVHQVDMAFDKKLSRLKKNGRYDKLYIENGNKLPFYDRLPEGSGIINTSEYPDGLHEIKIVAADVSGNSSTLRMPVRFTQPASQKKGK